MSRVLTPRRLKKLHPSGSEAVADVGVFKVERRTYPTLPRDVFVFAMPDWCNVIAETEAGELVMVWQHRFGTDDLSLEIPGGVIDRGEEPAAAARRARRR